MKSPNFNTVVLGGTFDHFHKGHRNFLEYGLSISKSLVVGITSSEFVKKFKINPPAGGQNSKSFETFETRKKSVENLLNKIAKGKFEVVKIDDILGPTLDKNFPAEAIIVSKDSMEGAEKINIEREKRGLEKFEIIKTQVVLAQDGRLLSSFRIRNGEIDREGGLFISPKFGKRNLYLPHSLRDEFRKPWGSLIGDLSRIKTKDQILIAVGDETSKTFNNLGVHMSISVIDFRVARKDKFKNIEDLGFSGKEEVITVNNPAGALTPQLFKTLQKAITLRKKTIIKINGEDDLSVLPMILISPLGAKIYYGQPGKGIVKIAVGEKIKEKARSILALFNTRGY